VWGSNMLCESDGRLALSMCRVEVQLCTCVWAVLTALQACSCGVWHMHTKAAKGGVLGFGVQTCQVWCEEKRCVTSGGAFPPVCLSDRPQAQCIGPNKADQKGWVQGTDSVATQACCVLCGPLCRVCCLS
jgi:hypothetical protein